MNWTRRDLLHSLLTSTIFAATSGVPLLGARRAGAQERPRLPKRYGSGKSVAIVGAGIAGLVSAYELLRAGFDVTVYEGTGRYGGRSLTVRPSDPDYKAWYLANNRLVRPDTYYDSIPAETRGAMVPEQTCKFVPARVGDGYFDLYLNAGPGRIPTHHTGILHYCREFGVRMEPYVYIGATNRLQADRFNDGKPVEFRQFLYDMQGYIAEMLHNAASGAAEGMPGDAKAIAEKLRAYLVQFGDLQPGGAFTGTSRAGYEVSPGAGTNGGLRRETLALEQMLDAYELWPELFDGERYEWQFPLLQPVGGMDMIWHAMLAQKPAGAALRDYVRLNHEITGLRYADPTDRKVTIRYSTPDGPGEATFDYVILTGVPAFVSKLDMQGLLGDRVQAALDSILYYVAGKYGWQAKRRFWEDPDVGIFGGISWTDHMAQQIWYPSDGYNGPTGVLTGAYNWDRHLVDADGRFYPKSENYEIPVRAAELPPNYRYASRWTALGHADRTKAALLAGEKLHPGFTGNVYDDRGMSIAWHSQPFQMGSGVGPMPETRPHAYSRLIKPIDRTGHVYLAGDAYGYFDGGWQEGAVRSVWWTLAQLRDHIDASEG